MHLKEYTEKERIKSYIVYKKTVVATWRATCEVEGMCHIKNLRCE